MQITLCDICRRKIEKESNSYFINFANSNQKLLTGVGIEVCYICKAEVEAFMSELKNKHKSKTVTNIVNEDK